MTDMEKEHTYKCVVCGTEIEWEGIDATKGIIWACEEDGCGKPFCRACFIEKHGEEHYNKMVNMDTHIRCPNCYTIRKGIYQ